MRKGIATSLFLLVLIGIVPDAYALDMEFYTYGGFDAISTAFRKLGLIFSDNDYKALFFSVMVLGILFGGAGAYFNLLKGAKGGVLAWVWPIGLGVVIYLGLIIPKGNITVYDPVMNKFETISNIPNAIVALAGTLNTIERGIVDIIDTSGTPSSYKDYGFSLGFDTLLKAVGGKPSFGDTFLDATMQKYEEDCLFFALQTAGTSGLNTRQLNSESTDFFTEYAKGQNPSVYTVVYDSTDPGGRSTSCTDAWVHLQAELSNPSSLEKLKRFACSRAGFNVNDAAQLQKCGDTLESFFGVTTGVTGMPSTTYLRQTYMAQSLENTIKSIDPDFSIRVLSDRGLMEKGIGTGMIMNDWIPVMKAVITAIAIGIIPILVIFIPTPLAGKAVGAAAGLFVWITMWGVTDAVVQNVVYEYGMRAFEIVKQNNLGLAAIMYMPNAALKALSMAGMCRGSSVLLATVLTSTLIKFGGYAFTHMMGGMMGAVGAQGAIGAGKTMEPQQHAKEVSGLGHAPVTMANPYKFDPSSRQRAEAMIATSQMRGRIEGTNMSGAEDAMALSTMSGLTGGAGRGGVIRDRGVETVTSLETTAGKGRLGGVEGDLEASDAAEQSVWDAHKKTTAIERSSNIAKAQEIGNFKRADAMSRSGVWKDWKRLENHIVGAGIMSLPEFARAKRGSDDIALTDAQAEKYNDVYNTNFKGGGSYSFGIDSDGKPQLTQTTRGKDETSFNRKQDLFRDTHQTGADYKAGVKVEGAPEIMDISPTAARARAEQGDPELALMLGTGSEKEQQRNTMQEARSIAEYLEKFASDKHTDIGAIIGKVYGNTDGNLGWDIPGWVKGLTGAKGGMGVKAGIGVEGNEQWRREKAINYLATGLYQAMNKAGKEGGHEGIEMGLDKLEAADKFSSSIENEVLGKAPLKFTPPLAKGKAALQKLIKDQSPDLGEKTEAEMQTEAGLDMLGGLSGIPGMSPDPTGGAGSGKTAPESSEPGWHKWAGGVLRGEKEGEETPIRTDTTGDIAKNVVGRDESGPASRDRQEPPQGTPQATTDREQVDTGKPGAGTILGAGMVAGMSRETTPATEQGTADMARGVADENENKPVSADSQRSVTTDMGAADREQVRKDDLSVDFSRPGKKSQSNISEQEIAKALNIEKPSGQDASAGSKIKEDDTPKSPGGGMGAG